MMKKVILYIVSLIISIIIFIFIYESISYVKYKESFQVKVLNVTHTLDKNYKKETFTEGKIDIYDSTEDEIFIRCEEDAIAKHDFLIDCTKKIEKVIKENINKNNPSIIDNKYTFFNDFKKSNPIIFIIYLLLIFTLVQQIYLFFLQLTENILTEKDFHISEWNINTAPMFGLLGTFLSIALLLNAGNENISDVLIKNFFDAVMTTIIGIIFYIINFYLKTFIYPSIKFND